MKRILSWIILVILLYSSLGYNLAQAQDKPIVIKLAHIAATGGMADKGARKFGEILSTKTGGRVKVDIYPAQQLGSITETLEGISMGSIDMGFEYEGFMEMFEKDFAIFTVPFLMTKEQIMKNEYLRELREKIRKRNSIRTLPAWGWKPALHLWTQKRIVRTPDELQGIKIRLWQQKVQIDMWNGLGARAIPLPWGEVYMALAQGLVDGMVHSIVQIYDEKFHEQLDYCTYLDYMPAQTPFWINDALYNKLPADIQKALDESSIEGAKYFTYLGESLEAGDKKMMEKKGVKFVQADRNIWFKKAHEIHKKLENEGSWSTGLLKKLGLE